MSASCECCVLSGRGLYDEFIREWLSCRSDVFFFVCVFCIDVRVEPFYCV